MAALIWDDTGKRFYENGVDHGVLYVMGSNGVYGTGVAWNGLTSVSESPDGAEPNDLWADNIKYATLYSNETFGATIEAYTYPEEFAQCDGSFAPVSGVYFGQQDRKSFGFSYRTKVGNDAGLDSYKLHIVYNCKASPSEKSYETINDSPDAITFSWEVTTTPVTIVGSTHRPLSSITIDVNQYISSADDSVKSARTAAIKSLEDSLYGSASSVPTLKSPSEVFELLYNATTMGATYTTDISL